MIEQTKYEIRTTSSYNLYKTMTQYNLLGDLKEYDDLDWEAKHEIQKLIGEAAAENFEDSFKTLMDLINDNILYAPIIARNFSALFQKPDFQNTIGNNFKSNMEQYTRDLMKNTNICKFDVFMIFLSELVNQLISGIEYYMDFIIGILELRNNVYLRPVLYSLFNCMATVSKYYLNSKNSEENESDHLNKLLNLLKEIELTKEHDILLKITDDNSVVLDTYTKMLLDNIMKGCESIIHCINGNKPNEEDTENPNNADRENNEEEDESGNIDSVAKVDLKEKEGSKIQPSIFHSYHTARTQVVSCFEFNLSSIVQSHNEFIDNGETNKITAYPLLISNWEISHLKHIHIINLLIHQTAGKRFKPKVLFSYSFNNVDEYKSNTRIDLTVKVLFSLVFAPKVNNEELLEKSYYGILIGKGVQFKDYMPAQLGRLVRYTILENVIRSFKMDQITSLINFIVQIFLISDSTAHFDFMVKTKEPQIVSEFYSIILKKVKQVVDIDESGYSLDFGVKETSLFKRVMAQKEFIDFNEKMILSNEIEGDQNTLLFDLVYKFNEGAEFVLYKQCENIINKKEKIIKWREIEDAVEVLLKNLWGILKDDVNNEVLIVITTLVEAEILKSEELIEYTKRMIAVLKESEKVKIHFLLALKGLIDTSLLFTDDQEIIEHENILSRKFEF